MNLAALLALLSLTITDATGDAIGDGTLDPPTAPVYANLAVFDLQAVDLQVAEDGSAVLSVTMGALGPAATGAPRRPRQRWQPKPTSSISAACWPSSTST